MTTPYANHSAGRIEPNHQTLKDRVKRLMNARKLAVNRWDGVMELAVRYVKEMLTTLRRYNPQNLVKGSDAHCRRVLKETHAYWVEDAKRNKKYYQQKPQQLACQAQYAFRRGDVMWVSNHLRLNQADAKLLPLWIGPYIFIWYLSNHRAILEQMQSGRWILDSLEY